MSPPAHIHTILLPHHPSTPIHIALFHSVTNAPSLLSSLLRADPAYDFAFLDPSLVLSYPHLLAAAHLALHAHLTARRKTRTPHSELVFRLHPNNNIGEAYRTFGMAADAREVLVVKFGREGVRADEVGAFLGDAVEGVSVRVRGGDEVAMYADEGRIRKVYKLVQQKKKKGVVNGERDEEGERKRLESVILGTMALKGS